MNIPDSNLRNMLNSISELNHVLNETLTLCKNSVIDCPDCGFDPIRKESTNPYCDTCDGKGKLSTPTFFNIPSSIETIDDIQFDLTKSGRLQDGEILATIDKKEITTILDTTGQFNMNTKGDIIRFIDQYDYFEWKGAKYTVKKIQPGYLQGNFYEISLTLGLKE